MLSSKQSSVPFIHLSISIHPSLSMPVLQDPNLESHSSCNHTSS